MVLDNASDRFWKKQEFFFSRKATKLRKTDAIEDYLHRPVEIFSYC